MIRHTSKEAYRTIKENGLLSEKRLQIYEILYNHGPLTYNEIFKILQGHSNIASANIGARLNEMKKMGCIIECGIKSCSVTGMNVILWDVTDKLPRKKIEEKLPTKNAVINKLCELLETAAKDGGSNLSESWHFITKEMLRLCERFRRQD